MTMIEYVRAHNRLRSLFGAVALVCIGAFAPVALAPASAQSFDSVTETGVKSKPFAEYSAVTWPRWKLLSPKDQQAGWSAEHVPVTAPSRNAIRRLKRVTCSRIWSVVLITHLNSRTPAAPAS